MLVEQSLANLSGCHVIIDAQSRETSYQNGGLTNTPYDINIVNIGTCEVDLVYLEIAVSDAILVSTWNLEQLDSTHYLVENTGGISPNIDFSGSGYILGSNNIDASVTVSLASAVCENSGDCSGLGSQYQNGPLDCVDLSCNCDQVCIQDGGVPRCETVYTSCPNQPSNCQATVSIQARAQSFWVSNGQSFQVYDITVQNSGQCDLIGVQLQINLSAGQIITQSWNLDPDNNLQNFGGSLSPLASFSSAGIIVEGTGSVTVSVKTPTCENC